MARMIASKLMVGYVLLLLGLTLGGFYQAGAPRNFVPFRSMEHDFRKGGTEFLMNFLGNVVVFLPMGWLLPEILGARNSARSVALASLALSLAIEVLQGLSGRRVADVDDLILNTLGGLIGYGFYKARDRFARPRPALEDRR